MRPINTAVLRAATPRCEPLESRQFLSGSPANGWSPEAPAPPSVSSGQISPLFHLVHSAKRLVGGPRFRLPKVGSQAAGNGLTAQYFANSALAGTPIIRVDKTVNFNWGKFAPLPSLTAGNFSVRWTGQLIVPKTGTYVFSATGTGAIALFVSGTRIFSNTGSAIRPVTFSGAVSLTAGKSVALEMDYHSAPRSMVALKWIGPAVTRQAVPAKYLLSETPAPAAPQAVSARVVSATEIDLGWQQSDATVAGFVVQRSTDGVNYSTLGSLASSTTSLAVTGLLPARRYFFKIVAINALGSATPSAVVSANTAGMTVIAIPINSLSASSGIATLTWSNPSSSISGFSVDRSDDGGGTWNTLANVGPTVLQYSDATIIDGNSYVYRVRGVSSSVADTYVGSGALAVELSAPNSPGAVPSAGSIQLGWTNTSQTASGVVIQKSADGGATWTTLTTISAAASSYTDSAVLDGRTYSYRINSIFGQLASAFTSPITATTPLSPPINLAVAGSPTGIQLTWANTSATSSGFVIQRSVDGGLWTPLESLSGATLTYTDTAVTRASAYDYRVIATATGEQSAPSGAAHVAASQAPQSPLNLAAKGVSDTEVNLTWDRNGPGETSITIYRSTGAGAFQQLVSLPAGTDIYTDTSCYPSTTYRYQITADNVNGSSIATAPVSATTQASLASYAATTALMASATSPFDVNLSWSTTTQSAYWQVERSSNGITYSLIAVFQAPAGLSVSYADTLLSPATTYDYRVRFITGTGYSNYSSVASAITAARTIGGPLEATGLSATVNSATNTTITWTDTNNGTASYVIETAPFSWTGMPVWTQIAQTAVGATTYNLNTTPETFYYLRIYASNGSGNSGYTPQVNIRSASPGTGSPQTYTVGPGEEYGSLAALNWSQLGPGDTVEIFPNRDSGGNIIPYYEKPLISVRGTAAAPINIVGMPDPATGKFPIIDGTNAVDNAQWDVSYKPLEDLSLVLIGNRPNTSTGWSPGYFNIENLDIRNGYSGDPGTAVNTYTASDGTTRSYADGSVCGIYIQDGDHITIKGCAIHSNNEGIFGAGQGDQRNLEEITLDSDNIYGNGTVNSFITHNTYLEGINTVYQFDTYGLLRGGADGTGLKDRGAGTVIRYSSFQGGGHLIDLVEAQNYASTTVPMASYHTTYVYGNVFYNTGPSSQQATTPIYYGGDQGITPMERKGALEFYNNTFVEQSDQSVQYYVNLFDLSAAGDSIDARNNIIAFLPLSTSTAPELDLLTSYGSAYFGTNWVSAGWNLDRPGYTFTGVAAGTRNFINNPQNNPGFVNAVTQNFLLAPISQAIGLSATLPAHDPPCLYEYTSAGGTLRADNATDLGALGTV